jgi:EAL domain-containing protein (putative c-di-GMP-specific phosphodiesterase class I)
MAEGYCKQVVEGRLPELIPNTALVPLARTIPETTSIPIGAHLSVPIRLKEGRVFGTFCCFSYHPNPQLDRRDLELMKTFAQLVARQIDAEIARDEETNRKLQLVREAVGRGDLRIVFQPICQLSDGKVTGVEALSRFSSEPLRSPDLWFKDAADVGLAESLELIAIRKAIAAAAVLPPHLTVSLNVSPAVAIAGRLADALSAFDPARTIVEVTEHDMIPDYQALIDALAPLRAKGVRIAIDDAGAGYSSLRHVLMLRPDIIKFDISITRGVDSDPMRRAMAAALAEFARHTGTKIVAEGIETPAELDVLKALGVEKGQGYLFGRPMDPERIAGFNVAAHAA